MMKRVSLFALIMVFMLVGTAYAVEVELFNETFTRGTGEPINEMRTFDIQGIGGPAILKITNGSYDSISKKVSSAIIKVNGVTVVDSSNLNKNIDSFEKETTLNNGFNTVDVLLKSKPGVSLNIRIVKNVEAGNAALITPKGGTLELIDPVSSIPIVIVKIPQGTISNDSILTITPIEDYPGLENGFIIGPVYDISVLGSHEFNNKISICFNLSDIQLTDEEKQRLALFYFDEQIEEWIFIPSSFNKIDQMLCVAVDHLTQFGPGTNPCEEETGCSQHLCYYEDYLEMDYNAIIDAEDNLRRAIGNDHYENIKYSSELLLNNSRELTIENLSDDQCRNLENYCNKRKSTTEDLISFNNGNPSSWNNFASDSKEALALVTLFQVPSFAIPPFFDPLSMMSMYAFSQIIKTNIYPSIDLLKESISELQKDHAIFDTFGKAVSMYTYFNGKTILDTNENISILIQGSMDYDYTDGQGARFYDWNFDLSLVKLNDFFSFNLVEPLNSDIKWGVCLDDNCINSRTYPPNLDEIDVTATGTYCFIYSFKGISDEFKYAGISLTVGDKLIAYDLIKNPSELDSNSKIGFFMIPRLAFTDLPSNQLKVTLRLFEKNTPPDSPLYGYFIFPIKPDKCTIVPPANTNDKLVAYYPFNDITINEQGYRIISDASGNGHNGTVYGNTTLVTGKAGQGCYFDGSGDYIQVSPNYKNELTNSPFSVAAWVKVTGVPIFSTSNSASFFTSDVHCMPERFIGYRNSDGGVNLYFASYYGCNQQNIVMIDNVELGNWYHLVATLDDSKLRLYVDGQLHDEEIFSYTSVATWDGSVKIGGNNRLGRYFEGCLDELRIYSRALDANDVKALYDSY